MTDSQVRLNKALARAGVASRRKADELIFAGRVTVNNETVDEPGRRIDPTKDDVAVDGRRVHFASDHTYVMLNKPIEVVTTASDPQGRATVFDILPKNLRKPGLVPVGRLDFYSEGLLLLTDDGELAHRMTHPSFEKEKIYQAVVRGEVTPEKIATMRQGMTLAEGEKLAPIKVIVAKAEPGRTTLTMTLIQGVNRQIRRMCRDLDLTILKLSRASAGPLKLGNLPPGKARELTPDEVTQLKKSAGLAG